ncbi:MAG: HD domain-containing protein [Candidatus Riflebacteria bacterium]
MAITVEDIVFAKQMEVPAGLREHMRAVAEMAAEYAGEVGYDRDAAYVAGMAHDLLRVASDEEILSLARRSNMSLTKAMFARPMLAHGPAAAAWLIENAPDVSFDIVDAVRDHTFPPSDAPILTQIIAVADTLEPSRKIPEREAVRLAQMTFSERFKRVFELKQNFRRNL